MGERKVLNKYYPPDFDPSLIPRSKKAKNEQHKVRMMVPFSVRCLSCGEYIGCGKKFNARKETVLGEEYLGIKIFRFYMRCTRCSSEITIKTDPANSDYVCEQGAVRNYESTIKKEGAEKENAKKKREDEEEGNAMKVLENRTMDNKMEMDILDGLDEIRALNARISKADTDDLLTKILNTRGESSEDDEEMEVIAQLKKNATKVADDVVEQREDTDWMTKKTKQASTTTEDGFKVPPKPKQTEKPKKQSKIGLGGSKVTLKFPAQSRDSAVILPEDGEDVQTEGGFSLGY